MSSTGTARGFAEEVAGRFGVLPNFFCSAPTTPVLVEELWTFARSAYLDSPLPSLFKERLFVHLSRFCEVRYCIVRHAGFLMGEGRPAGDATVQPHTLEQTLMLLRRPVPDAIALEQIFLRLEARDEPPELPIAETQEEADLFDALTVMFLAPGRSTRARSSVRRAVGESRFEILTAFLVFVRTAHYWTEMHPEFAYEPDMLACMEQHPELARLLLDTSEAEQASAQLRKALDQIHAIEGSLREIEQRYRTPRKEADDALRASEERLRRALETGAVGVLFFDKKGVLISANRVFMTMTGWSREDVASGTLNWRTMTPPEWVALSEVQMQQLAEGGRLGPYEKEYLCKDGRRAWMMFTGRDLGDGTIVKFAIDISERKQAEAAQAAQREALEAALNGEPLETSLGVLVRTATEQLGEGVRAAFYLANPEGPSLYNVVGMPAAYAGAVDGSKIASESIACGLATQSCQPVITADVAAEPLWAPWVWIAEKFNYRGCWSFPINTVNGKLVGSFAIYSRQPREATARDLALARLITESAAIIIARYTDTELRKRAEEALRESEARFRQFAEASSDILWIRDAETLEWEYLSPAFDAIYGVESSKMMSNAFQHWAELVEPDDRERAVENLRRVRQGERLTHEFRIRRRSDGEMRWIRDTDFPLVDQTGRVQRIGGIGQDVTGEKATADRLQVMVAEQQHRTRNLIAVVRSIAAQTMAMTGPTEAFRDGFNHRLEALARVQALLSRSDETPITLERLIRIELDALGALAGGNGRITLHGPSVRLRSSIVQTLTLALHELATNARKYGALSDGDGRLRVTWQLHQAAEGPRLALDWIETRADERIDTTPARRGYGRELIEQALPYALGATTTYELSAEGARCMIDMPLERPRQKRTQ